MKAFFSAVLIIVCIGFPITIIGAIMAGGADSLWRFVAALVGYRVKIKGGHSTFSFILYKSRMSPLIRTGDPP